MAAFGAAGGLWCGRALRVSTAEPLFARPGSPSGTSALPSQLPGSKG